MSGFINFELNILDILQLFLSYAWLNPFWVYISWIGNSGVIWIILSIVLTIYPKTRVVGIMCLLSLAFSGIGTNLLLKNMFARPRPFTYNNFPILIEAPWDHSFPSGHTSAAFSFGFVVLKQELTIGGYKIYKVLLVLATLMSLSRLVLYLHFPTDIIGAIGVAYLFAWSAIKLVSRWTEPKENV